MILAKRKREQKKTSCSVIMEEKIQRLKNAIEEADGIVLGAGAGLSASAGFDYSGARFQKYFQDFSEKYHFTDMYSGGFYSFETPEEHWAYWSRFIYVNRYMEPLKPVYTDLLELMEGKDYFVLTTNVDHCFQKGGFDKHRLFYTQGDYGLFQCARPCHQETYDNQQIICRMVAAQGYEITSKGALCLPESGPVKMRVPSEMIPRCPKCGSPMSMNLRADDRFVEDEGWHQAALRYRDFLRRHKGMKILFLELGVGYNTPGIIKYPFWQETYQNPGAVYACVNYGDEAAPGEIADRSICIDGDIGEVLKKLK